ncbi:MAG TPA: malto-oligosyltrehalose trehalohydrolase [Planctomicrobium sp.]|nr:malto-oligosyltrehalose trehalohydrolase [Planctomicrobium sp.]
MTRVTVSNVRETPLSDSNQPNRKPHHGAILHDDGSTEWNVWAPHPEWMDLVIDPERQPLIHAMKRDGDWFRFREMNIQEGTPYRFRLPAGDYPDPATRWQPEGVSGPSALFFPERYEWRCDDWRGVARKDLVIYELHVGTFTQEGTFAAITDRLDDLKSLGITAIEIMPVGQFPGNRNWGYDGVQPYAVQNSYGGPREFQKFIDDSHQAGIAVILDVVYNHLGPEGNFLPVFGPYFTQAYHTSWGEALNYDGPDSDSVRQYVIENACMWIRDFRLDGLRLDAVHAIYDFSARHLLAEMQQEIRQIANEQGRFVHLIAESDQNDPRLIDPPDQHGLGLDAVWADELHHSVHTLLTGEHQGYFRDFGQIEQLAKAYEKVFVYDGEYSVCRRRRHGGPVKDRDRSHFVVCLQNHDQIGNRAKGDRPAMFLSEAQQRLACGLFLISPCIPLVFMGSEYGERNPFPFFCSFSDSNLTEAVRRGRRTEFENLGFQWGTEIPDPAAPETYCSAKLSWSWPEGAFSAGLRQLYHDLLQARREWPALRNRSHTKATVIRNSASDSEAPSLLLIERGDPERVTVLANLSESPCPVPTNSVGHLTIRLSTEEERYGGTGGETFDANLLQSHELRIYGAPHD